MKPIGRLEGRQARRALDEFGGRGKAHARAVAHLAGEVGERPKLPRGGMRAGHGDRPAVVGG